MFKIKDRIRIKIRPVTTSLAELGSHAQICELWSDRKHIGETESPIQPLVRRFVFGILMY